MPNTGLKAAGTPVLQVAAGVVRDAQGRVLIARRPAKVHQGGLWEFPGGKLEPGESVQQALVRELHEEVGIDVLGIKPLICIKHEYPDLAVQLHVFWVDGFSGQAHGREGQPFAWVTPQELDKYRFPAANRAIVNAVKLPGGYAILDNMAETALMTHLEKLLSRGVTLIQARLKTLPPGSVRRFIRQAYSVCQAAGAVLLINSVHAGLGLTADGLHLTGRDLMALTQKPEGYRWLAASCHNAEELLHAADLELDFAVLAPVLATQSHPDKAGLGWAAFERLVADARLPVYALGGLSLADLDTACVAGGQGIASIRAFWD
ncbi:MAG: DNA mismatch repair protein MutT [Methylobacter sp.]|nr:MAG: DNA mismatch repair protein MutT [Methylobacter sp.]